MESGRAASIETLYDLDRTLGDLGKDARVMVYDDFVSAFSYPVGQRYQAEGLDDAWGETIALFEKHLLP